MLRLSFLFFIFNITVWFFLWRKLRMLNEIRFQMEVL